MTFLNSADAFPEHARVTRRGFLRTVTLATAGLVAGWPASVLAGRGGGPSGSTFRFGTANGQPVTWDIKQSTAKVGPGPNLFSGNYGTDSGNDLWTDGAGLHLTVTNRGGRWWCTEVIGPTLGYGTYQWTVSSDLAALAAGNPSAVLGLFTWDDNAAQDHREIDIEFSKWGSASRAVNSQYVVQPSSAAGHLRAFSTPSLAVSTHQFTWHADSVGFRSWPGSAPPPSDPAQLLQNWNFGPLGVPDANGAQRVRMNLWLFRGRAPESKERVEVVLSNFSFAAG